MKRYNSEIEKYKKLYFKPYEVVKAYILAIILALAICLIIYLPLLNMIYLTHYFKLIVISLLVTTLFGIYLMLYFKDKALEMYNSEAKNVNLFYIRMVDMLITSLAVIIIFIAFILIFRW